MGDAGEGPGPGPGSPTLFLDQTEAKRNEKILRLGPHLISGSGWRPPHPPYLKVWVCHWGPTLGDVLPKVSVKRELTVKVTVKTSVHIVQL